MTDRTVHATTKDGAEIVHYDRAGKWYLENPDSRRPITFNEAVDLACHSIIRLGLPGGTTFDRHVARRMQEKRDAINTSSRPAHRMTTPNQERSPHATH